MGKYDKEVKQEITELKKIYSSPAVDGDVFSPKEIYDNLKSNILREVYIPDMLVCLVNIKDNLHTSAVNILIDDAIEALGEQMYKPYDLIPQINQLIVYLIKVLDKQYTMEKIMQSVWHIYITKNAEYGDVWYKRHSVGICLDMGRKIVRIANGNKDADTAFDLLLYCVFLKVYLLHIENGE